MNRRLAATLIGALVLTISLVGTALAGSFSDSEYQGRAESDPFTFVGFDVDKQGDVKKVKRIRVFLRIDCTNGDSGQFGLAGKRPLRVKEDNTFKGKMAANGLLTRGGSQLELTFSGKLLKQGKATGRVRADLDYGSFRCYTGTLNWKTKRGAIVNPNFPPRPGRG